MQEALDGDGATGALCVGQHADVVYFDRSFFEFFRWVREQAATLHDAEHALECGVEALVVEPLKYGCEVHQLFFAACVNLSGAAHGVELRDHVEQRVVAGGLDGPLELGNVERDCVERSVYFVRLLRAEI